MPSPEEMLKLASLRVNSELYAEELRRARLGEFVRTSPSLADLASCHGPVRIPPAKSNEHSTRFTEAVLAASKEMAREALARPRLRPRERR